MLKSIVNILYPPLCLSCGEKLLGDEECLCSVCISRMPRAGGLATDSNLVAQRLAGIIPYERACGVFLYSPGNIVARLIHDFKYHNCAALARRLGQLMFQELIFTDFFTDVDAVAPLPIHWTRKLKRTYNQALMLTEGVSSQACLPVVEALKARRHSTQTRLHGAERLANTFQKYYVNPSCENFLQKAERIVIIDDVCTTGSTLMAASKALLAEYPHLHLSILTMAVTV